MTKVSFSEMSLTPKVERAVSRMGFDFATPIQAEAIPVIRTGADVIARSQTGTGKTVAFAIPAIERIDTEEAKPTIQVLVLCPTRELALQACEEIQKLARFKEGIHPVAIYGGAPIDKQCIALRRANLVVGTPGRVMDHMRRKTIKLTNLKMIVLDEADEMLNMGFKEDIETILTDTPETRQTVLFSATMPPAILKITAQFQNDPVMIEIDKSQVTLENIDQRYIHVPRQEKKRALDALLQYYQPQRAIIFCGTKRMADELTDFINSRGVRAGSIHSDIRQTQRISTLQDFKAGKTAILVATDIAARGIDVSDVDYVINYDLPPNTEYYIHRIGRTGRAGKDGCTITICSTPHEVGDMRRIAVEVKSEIRELPLPTADGVRAKRTQSAADALEAQILRGPAPEAAAVVDLLLEKGYDPRQIAEAALSRPQERAAAPQQAEVAPMHEEADRPAGKAARAEAGKRPVKARPRPVENGILLLDIGSSNRITANHIIGAITERTGIPGREIGKIDIAPDQSLVEIPADRIEQVLEDMRGCKICGKPTRLCLLADPPRRPARRTERGNRKG